MKRYIIVIALLVIGLTSCKKFLEEDSRTSIPGEEFFTTATQIESAVRGAYVGLERPYTSVFLGLPISEYWSVEALTGFSLFPFANGADENSFKNLETIDGRNGYLKEVFSGTYIPMANINNVIQNLSTTTVVDEATKNRYLGEMYFLRAWHYFHIVQLMGEVPLITTYSTAIDPASTQVPKATREKIYNQIVDDLVKAEASGLAPRDESGRVNMTAVKSLLAKVYLTMAGYPLQKGQEYYELAYEKAKEVIEAGDASLAPTYAALRTQRNTGEQIFQVQRMLPIANNELVLGMYPGPGESDPVVSTSNIFTASLQPTPEFYNTYADNDLRKTDRNFFYRYNREKEDEYNNDPDRPDAADTVLVMNYKFWDNATVTTGRSDQNIWLIRYADVLLVCAEAKANVDGGTTSDAVALQAYNDVHTRAIPGDAKASVTVDEVIKERFWELAFEYVTWYDMLRTRKTFDFETNSIVSLIGFQAKVHKNPFTEDLLTFPLPTEEIQKNPKLDEPAQ